MSVESGGWCLGGAVLRVAHFLNFSVIFWWNFLDFSFVSVESGGWCFGGALGCRPQGRPFGSTLDNNTTIFGWSVLFASSNLIRWLLLRVLVLTPQLNRVKGQSKLKTHIRSPHLDLHWITIQSLDVQHDWDQEKLVVSSNLIRRPVKTHRITRQQCLDEHNFLLVWTS